MPPAARRSTPTAPRIAGATRSLINIKRTPASLDNAENCNAVTRDDQELREYSILKTVFSDCATKTITFSFSSEKHSILKTEVSDCVTT